MLSQLHREPATFDLATKPSSAHEIGGRPFVVIDDLFSPEVADATFSLFRDLDYRLIDADRPDTEEFRHFVRYFPRRDWSENPILKFMIDAASSALDTQGWQHSGISRIYANLTLAGDHQFIHTDGYEWTALFFLTDRWLEDWGGELTMYGDSPFEPAISLLPRPGRLVVFDGEIPHRGGCPSRHCSAPRISVALKFRRNTTDA